MRPEFVAHQVGPHANVKCVECHVGPGASSFAKSKLAGTRRVLAVALNNYPRPIVAAPEQLVSAADSCEQCHWPELFHGDKVRRISEYADDEKNTESVTTLHVHVGGGNGRIGLATGIHWHMNVGNTIEFVATDDGSPDDSLRADDGSRGQRPRVRRRWCDARADREGRTRAAWTAWIATIARATPLPPRRSEPSTRRWRAATFRRRCPSSTGKRPRPSRCPTRRRTSRCGKSQARWGFLPGPGTAGVGRARAGCRPRPLRACRTIYRRNVFPEMKVSFGTYPNNIGHVDFPGCFRCHDDNHTSRDGKKIAQDCDTCHEIE